MMTNLRQLKSMEQEKECMNVQADCSACSLRHYGIAYPLCRIPQSVLDRWGMKLKEELKPSEKPVYVYKSRVTRKKGQASYGIRLAPITRHSLITTPPILFLKRYYLTPKGGNKAGAYFCLLEGTLEKLKEYLTQTETQQSFAFYQPLSHTGTTKTCTKKQLISGWNVRKIDA
jgi:hypothetical protein